MLDNFKRSVQSFTSDVYFGFRTTIDRTGPSTTLDTRVPPNVEETAGLSPSRKRRASSMSAYRGTFTQSVPRFLEEVEAEDADSDKILTQPQVGTGVLPTRTIPDPLSRPNLHTAYRRTERASERRALGVPEKTPPDAVPVPDPMRKPLPFSGPLQPRNTLDQPKSRKDAYYHKQMVSKREKQHEVRENNHEKPNKRQKNGSSPSRGSSRSHVIDLECQPDGPISDQMSLSLEATDVPHTSLPNTSGLQTEFKSVMVKVPRRRPSISTPDTNHKFLTSDSSDESGDEAFTKEARRQRIDGDFDEEMGISLNSVATQTKTRLDTVLSSPPAFRLPDRNSAVPRQDSLASNQKRKSLSKMEARLQLGAESPDALQGDATTKTATAQSLRGSRPVETARGQSQSHANMAVSSGRRQKYNKTSVTSSSSVQVFPLDDYEYYKLARGKNMVLKVSDKHDLTFDFENPIMPEKGPIFSLPVKSIVSMYWSQPGEKARIYMMTRSMALAHRKLYFGFTEDTVLQDFVALVQSIDSNVRADERGEKFMTSTFNNAQKHFDELARSEETRKVSHVQEASPIIQTHKTGNYFPGGHTGVEKARLAKLSDQPIQRTVITGAERAGSDGLPQARSSTRKSQTSNNEGLLVRRETTAPRNPTRSTRSRSSKIEDLDETDTKPPVKKESEFKKLKSWNKSLVYPFTGKKRETVHFDDLQRLDDEEFLNDNLVSLFLRYLEEHAEKEQMRKIHFFNSFLFDTLTKDVKARRDINFESVKRWTAKVDLFSRDFVVVPVNEHLHWFVMIICNLSYFRRKYAFQTEDDGEDSQFIQPIQHMAEKQPEVFLRSDLGETTEATTRNSFAEMSLDDQEIPTSSPLTMKTSSNGRGRRRAKPLPKYDVDKPIIITLDSLGHPRSTTATILRQYIVAEAKDKQGWDIDGNDIKGMTAKDIPIQDNFSDCGLYLCMYLEQFILEPYGFVHRILQRTHGAGWPDKIKSSDLRKRLRELLLKLHEQQSGKKLEADLPSLGSILVTMGQDDVEVSGVARVEHVSTGPSPGADRTCGEINDRREGNGTNDAQRERENVIDSMQQWQQMVNQPIEIPDEPQTHTKSSRPLRETDVTSDYFAQRNPHASPAESDQRAAQDPVALAEYLRRCRSPDRPDEEEITRAARSDSISTDFLTSGKGYDDDDGGSVSPRPSTSISRSPRKSTDRRSHKKFKKQDVQKHRHFIEIEDDLQDELTSMRKAQMLDQRKPRDVPNEEIRKHQVRQGIIERRRDDESNGRVRSNGLEMLV